MVDTCQIPPLFSSWNVTDGKVCLQGAGKCLIKKCSAGATPGPRGELQLRPDQQRQKVHRGHKVNVHLNYSVTAKGGGYGHVLFPSPLRKH